MRAKTPSRNNTRKDPPEPLREAAAFEEGGGNLLQHFLDALSLALEALGHSGFGGPRRLVDGL